jgi:disulfide bond formation protein DsbB
MRSERLTAALLLVGPAALLGGALAFQYLGGLPPCEMCLWQRWALVTALALALLGCAAGYSRAMLMLAALAVLAGAGIAVFHVGVEQHWWKGITECAATPVSGSAADVMSQILAQPLVRCDAIAWSLFGISMAGWNALISGMIGGMALWRLK